MRTLTKLCAALGVLMTAAPLAAAQAVDTPTLPAGPLALIGGGGGAVIFVDQARTTRSGTTADAWTLVVTDPPVNRSTFDYQHQSFDCAGHTIALLGVWGFDAHGRMVVQAPAAHPPTAIRPGSLGAVMAGSICDGKAPQQVVTGYAAAMKAAERLISAYEQPGY